jgi:hypothetical protein
MGERRYSSYSYLTSALDGGEITVCKKVITTIYYCKVLPADGKIQF